MADLNYIDRDAETKIVGQDATGNSLNYVSADVNGNMFVKDYADGPVAAGTAAANSNLIGGIFNTTLPTLTTGQQAALQADSSGRLLIGSIAAALPAGANNIGSVNQGTSPWVIAGSGTAGTSATGVVTVQGIAGGTAIPISGTVTATNPSVSATGSTPPPSATYIGGSVTTAAPAYTAGQMNALSLTTAGLLRVDGSGVTQPVSGTIAATQSGAWSTGRTWTLASGTDSVSSVQSGTWTVQPGNTANTTPWLVTVSTALPAGANTIGSVNQGTSPWIVQDNASNTSATTAVARGLQTMGVFNTTPATLTTGQAGFLQLDTSQNLLVNLKTALPAGANTIGSVNQGTSPWVITGSGTAGSAASGVVTVQGIAGGTAIPISGTVTATNPSVSTTGTAPPASATYIGGSVTTAAPAYTTGQMNALSLTTTGLLRVDGSGVIQPISGTVAATQSGAWTTGRTWTLASGTDSVSSVQSGSWTVQPGNTANTTPWLVTDSNSGPVTPGTVAGNSGLAAGQYNTTLPTLTATQQAALQLDSSGRLITNVGVTAPPSNLLSTGTLTGTGQTVTLTLQGTASVNVDVSGPGFVGTITVTETTPSQARTLGVFALNASALAMSITANGNYRVVGVPTSGSITVAFIAYTSGSATINIYGSTAPYIVQPYSANAANVLITSYLNDGSGNSISSTSGSLNVNLTNAITSNQGTPNTTANSWPIKITDGTNVVGVTAASAAAVATQPAAVVALSPNTSLPAGTNNIGTVSTNKTALTYSAPTTASVPTTSATIVAANANRKGLYLSNTSPQQISLGFNGNAAVYQNGLTLFPGEKFWMDEYSFSTGAVTAVTTGAGTYIGVQEITT